MVHSVPIHRNAAILNESFWHQTVNKTERIKVDSLCGGWRRLKTFFQWKHSNGGPFLSFKRMCFLSGCRFWWKGLGVMWPRGPKRWRMKRPQLSPPRSRSCNSAAGSFYLELMSELVVKQGGAAYAATHDGRVWLHLTSTCVAGRGGRCWCSRD